MSPTGELVLQLRGSMNRGPLDLKPVPIVGELAEVPYSDSSVSLIQCLQTGGRFGTGGTQESWWAHRGLFGPRRLSEDATFSAVEMGISGLRAFVGEPSVSVRAITTEAPPQVFAQIDCDDWTGKLEMQSRIHAAGDDVTLTRTPAFSIQFREALRSEAILEEVIPVFEFILTLSRREHASVETVHLTNGRERFELLGPRFRAPQSSTRPASSDLLFKLSDLSSLSEVITRAREIFRTRPAFTAVYLGNERSPPRYAEDRLRSAVVALAHLGETTAPDGADSSEDSDFRAPASLLAVPKVIASLVTPTLSQSLGMGSPADFARAVAKAYRWSTYQEGPRVEGVDLVAITRQLRALIHVRALALFGIAYERAEQLVRLHPSKFLTRRQLA